MVKIDRGKPFQVPIGDNRDTFYYKQNIFNKIFQLISYKCMNLFRNKLPYDISTIDHFINELCNGSSGVCLDIAICVHLNRQCNS